MANRALAGLLTVTGAGMRGGFHAMGKNAEQHIKDASIKKRDENLARLQAEADTRRHGFRTKEITQQGDINAANLKTSDVRRQGYAQSNIRLQDELAGNREELLLKKQNIIYKRRRDEEEQTYQRRVAEEEKRYERRLQEGREERKVAIAERLEAVTKEFNLKEGAKTSLEKQYDFMEKKFGKDKAETLIIGSLIKAKDTGVDKAKAYSEIYNEYLETLAGGLAPTPEMEKKAKAETDKLFRSMGISIASVKAKPGTEKKTDAFAELQSNIDKGGGDPEKRGDSLLGIKSAEAGETDTIPSHETEPQGLIEPPRESETDVIGSRETETPGLLNPPAGKSTMSINPENRDPDFVRKVKDLHARLKTESEANGLDVLSEGEILSLIKKYGPEIIDEVRTINDLWRKISALKQ